VLVWNYHDDDLPAPAANVELTIDGLPGGRPWLTEYRVDADHSNSYEAWKKMGSPQKPTRNQYAQLEKAGKLQTIGGRKRVRIEKGQLRLMLTLPRQGVSLLKVDY
jgi:xylan 1,4-beta-xylosidase